MKLGDWGEELIVGYLAEKGFRLVERNWHSRYGEIDIIAENGELLLFVEVKTRKSGKFSQPYEAVDYRKQQKIRTTVETYLMKHPSSLQPRLDVASVVAPQGILSKHPEITYLEQAF